jgi:hypothetical protein
MVDNEADNKKGGAGLHPDTATPENFWRSSPIIRRPGRM